MKPDKNELSERHIAQIIRRKMIQRVKQSKKKYNRKNKHKHDQAKSE